MYIVFIISIENNLRNRSNERGSIAFGGITITPDPIEHTVGQSCICTEHPKLSNIQSRLLLFVIVHFNILKSINLRVRNFHIINGHLIISAINTDPTTHA